MPPALLPLRFTVDPVHNAIAATGVIPAVILGFTVIETEFVALHPLVSVTV